MSSHDNHAWIKPRFQYQNKSKQRPWRGKENTARTWSGGVQHFDVIIALVATLMSTSRWLSSHLHPVDDKFVPTDTNSLQQWTTVTEALCCHSFSNSLMLAHVPHLLVMCCDSFSNSRMLAHVPHLLVMCCDSFFNSHMLSHAPQLLATCCYSFSNSHMLAHVPHLLATRCYSFSDSHKLAHAPHLLAMYYHFFSNSRILAHALHLLAIHPYCIWFLG